VATRAELAAARALIDEADAQECELLYQLELFKARASLLAFTRLMHYDPDRPGDPRRSRYEVRPVHRLLAETLERVERGDLKRVIFVLPPRTGKTELASHKFPAWYIGRRPQETAILATYNGIFATDFGVSILETVKSARYGGIFPGVELLGNARSSTRMTTNYGGSIFCIGRENSASGRGADLMVIDDPIKDRKEAQSPKVRDNIWQWFSSVAMSRLMSKAGRVLIIMTRWHEDDLVGRLIDPHNAFYRAAEAARWTVINIPAIAETNDLLGRAPGEVLWPERFPLEHLQEHKERDPQSFNALYQGRPSPEEGDFFKAADIRTYSPRELPKNLRYYITSDHAVTANVRSNKTVMLVGGVDDDMNLWIVDCYWRKVDTEAAVEAMLILMARYAPLVWTAELGHISKAIGPFLRRRMREENVVCNINEVHPVRDKPTRCQSIQARMSLGRVFFPGHASWFEDAKRTLLSFPNSDDDDFADALGLFGMQLDRMVAPGKASSRSRDSRHVPRMGTLEWVKASAEARRAFEVHSTGGW
jgi:predicted phage terminase large subunit-like protein